MKQETSHITSRDPIKNWVDVKNPSTGKVLAQVAFTLQAELEEVLERAYALFKNKKNWLALHQRVEILEKLAVSIRDSRRDLAILIAREGGKPLTDALVEVDRAVLGVKRCVEVISSDQGSVVPLGAHAFSASRRAFTSKQPIGVALAISAFNHPLNLIVHQVATAVAVGAPVIVKPSPDTPLTCIRFIEMLKAAGLPKGWATAVLPETLDLAEMLVTDDRISFFSFIGSARVGWALRSKLKPGVRFALEHGGAAPAFVTGTADLPAAVETLAKGAFYHAGQVCVSTQRIFVDGQVSHEFTQTLKDRVESLKVGDAILEETEVGPLIRESEVHRVAQWVNDAVSEGAELITGGQAITTRFYKPTLLLNAPRHSKVSREEVFGPVAVIQPYEDLSGAIEQANALPFAFQAAVFARDIDEINRLYFELDASAIMINDHTAFREDGMPFAGLKHSGFGVGGIDHTIHDLQIDKMMVMKL
ncbi:aldehyde dehydrogenase family protein [Flexibacterium corallicola]|uniref:aldehyde dehydrogenase family protein n=1 Tax=Flexibacterium corallicola TaxID=3037259 RepID=UPI00286F9FD9|nr:aldehyde dehydrogenase family protein [Pseudovibrio sp. M1P-2-3]